MSVEDTEELDSQNQPTEEVENTEDVEETSVEEETEDTSEDVETLKQKNVDLYDRAKKAEAQMRKMRDEQKQKKEQVSTPSETGSLTIRDLAAIKDLEADDVEWLANYATKMGLTLSDARKDKDVKTILIARDEERRTAVATSTGNNRRGTMKVTDDALLKKAEEGDLPTDHESLMRIAATRLKKRASPNF